LFTGLLHKLDVNQATYTAPFIFTGVTAILSSIPGFTIMAIFSYRQKERLRQVNEELWDINAFDGMRI